MNHPVRKKDYNHVNLGLLVNRTCLLKLYKINNKMVSASQVNKAKFQFSSVAQSCLTLCDTMSRSMPGLPVITP